MYATYNDITSILDERKVLDLVNDESRDYVSIDMESTSDAAYVRFNAAAQSAKNLIDGYLRTKYTLPLSTTPELIKHIAADITVYLLFKRRMDIPDVFANIYKTRVSELEKIQMGKIILDVPSQPDVATGAGELVINKIDSDRVFNREMLDGFSA